MFMFHACIGPLMEAICFAYSQLGYGNVHNNDYYDGQRTRE